MSSLNHLPLQYINLKTPLQFGPAGAFDLNVTTLEAVADDLKILLDTNWGERVVQYDFGANLRALVFSQSSEIEQQVTDAITLAVDKWMPYVTILRIQVITNDQDITVPYNKTQVKVSFTVGKTGLQGDVTVNI